VVVTRSQLRSRAWRRLFRNVFVWAGVEDDLELRAEAAEKVLPTEAVVSGASAAWIWGVDLRRTQDDPLEVTVPRGRAQRAWPGLVVRRALLPEEDVVRFGRVRVTHPLRTAFDLARRPPLVDGVAAVDALCHRRMPRLEELRPYVAEHRRWRGVRLAERVVDLARPGAESPMETRQRLLLVLGGLPEPLVQYEVRDRDGVLIGRLDLAYPERKLGIEFDGLGHLDPRQWRADLRRQNALLRAGWRLLRFSASDVYRRPDAVLAQVRAALLAAA
jgi:hypothetical protein